MESFIIERFEWERFWSQKNKEKGVLILKVIGVVGVIVVIHFSSVSSGGSIVLIVVVVVVLKKVYTHTHLFLHYDDKRLMLISTLSYILFRKIRILHTSHCLSELKSPPALYKKARYTGSSYEQYIYVPLCVAVCLVVAKQHTCMHMPAGRKDEGKYQSIILAGKHQCIFQCPSGVCSRRRSCGESSRKISYTSCTHTNTVSLIHIRPYLVCLCLSFCC